MQCQSRKKVLGLLACALRNSEQLIIQARYQIPSSVLVPKLYQARGADTGVQAEDLFIPPTSLY
jgi:hypothetical protein